MAKVSVIIPVYATEAYLSDCLDSVLNQSLHDLEVIAIDDCSPDRCGAILDEYAGKDDRLKVIHLEENRRQGYARNRGLEKACGDYVYFLDSDDMITNDAMKELSELCDRDTLDGVFFDCSVIYENEEMKKHFPSLFPVRKGTYRDEVYEGKDLMDDFIRQNEWTCYPQHMFWRRSFLLQEGIAYPEGVEHEDEFFAFAAILSAKWVRYVHEPYFKLRIRPDSVMTSRMTSRNFHGYLMNYYAMNRFLLQRNVDSFAANVNIARMWERAMTLYASLKNEYDLSVYFEKEPDHSVYHMFQSYQQTQKILHTIDPEVLDEIKKYRIVYIYGTKLTAQRFYQKLERYGEIPIGGFIAQSGQETPKIIMGRPVYDIDEIAIPEDAIVVAAIKIVFWEETRKIFEKRKIRCIFHRKQ